MTTPHIAEGPGISDMLVQPMGPDSSLNRFSSNDQYQAVGQESPAETPSRTRRRRHLNNNFATRIEPSDETPVDDFLLWWRNNYELRQILSNTKSDDVPPIGQNARHFSRAARPHVLTKQKRRSQNVDLQGIDWHWLNASKRDALSLRKWKCKLLDWTHSDGSNRLEPTHGFSSSSNYECTLFRTTFRPRRGIWQLCNSITAPCAASTFYASGPHLYRAKTHSSQPQLIFDAGTSGDPGSVESIDSNIRAIASSHGTLVCSTWSGITYVTSLSASVLAPFHKFTLSSPAPVNHVSVHLQRRSSTPVGCIAANAPAITILDVLTLQALATQQIPWSTDISTSLSPSTDPFPNATATSPDARLRLVVGDTPSPVILDVDSGTHLATLPSHRDHVFAAAWSQDGIHAATAAQDDVVQVFDARRWDAPLMVLAARMAGPRYLEFSPLGSGRQVLLMAEPQDVIGVANIGASTGAPGDEEGARKDWEFLGIVAGAGFVGNGEGRFVVGVQDRSLGGLMEFERSGMEKGWGMGDHSQDEISGLML